MLQVTTSAPFYKSNDRDHLARIRYQARKRGFRLFKDWSGTWSLVDARIEPPRALVGLFHVPLKKIEAALRAPLPVKPPRRRKAVPANAEAALRRLLRNGRI
jgi:hypothetical protein